MTREDLQKKVQGLEQATEQARAMRNNWDEAYHQRLGALTFARQLLAEMTTPANGKSDAPEHDRQPDSEAAPASGPAA
jgi:hypothetical protein